MKRYGLIFLVVAMSCSTDSPTSTDETTSAVIPQNGVPQIFADTPDLKKLNFFDATGKIISTGYTKNERYAGSWVELYPNGLPKTITTYVDGKKEGLSLELTNNGQVSRQIYYHQNLKHGDYKEYNYAVLKEERFYENDKLEGLVKIFYGDGKIMEEGAYKNGTRHGISRWYDQVGTVTIEYEYDNGQLIRK